ncbi:MAG: histone H1-like repetitive region-containing protein [bacterium]|nr:histone H1-like repetitive region-containing protein [bacterium]
MSARLKMALTAVLLSIFMVLPGLADEKKTQPVIVPLDIKVSEAGDQVRLIVDWTGNVVSKVQKATSANGVMRIYFAPASIPEPKKFTIQRGLLGNIKATQVGADTVRIDISVMNPPLYKTSQRNAKGGMQFIISTVETAVDNSSRTQMADAEKGVPALMARTEGTGAASAASTAAGKGAADKPAADKTAAQKPAAEKAAAQKPAAEKAAAQKPAADKAAAQKPAEKAAAQKPAAEKAAAQKPAEKAAAQKPAEKAGRPVLTITDKTPVLPAAIKAVKAGEYVKIDVSCEGDLMTTISKITPANNVMKIDLAPIKIEAPQQFLINCGMITTISAKQLNANTVRIEIPAMNQPVCRETYKNGKGTMFMVSMYDVDRGTTSKSADKPAADPAADKAAAEKAAADKAAAEKAAAEKAAAEKAAAEKAAAEKAAAEKAATEKAAAEKAAAEKAAAEKAAAEKAAAEKAAADNGLYYEYFPVSGRPASEMMSGIKDLYPNVTFLADDVLNVIYAEGSAEDLVRLRRIFSVVSK